MNIEKFKEKLFEKLVKKGEFVKDDLEKYNKDFEEKKSDIKWVKKAASRLSAKECTEEPLFLKLVEQLDNLEPTAESKLYLSQLERNKGNISKSIEYLEESASSFSTNKEIGVPVVLPLNTPDMI